MQLFSADAKICLKEFKNKRLKKTPQKVAYLWQLGMFFFSAAPTAQNSTELHFRFINSFIQPSLVGSLFGSEMSVNITIGTMPLESLI